MLLGRYVHRFRAGKRVTFRELALECAQSFIVNVHHDMLSPMLSNRFVESLFDEEIHPGDHHLEIVEATKKRLAEVERWDNTLAKKEAKKSFNERRKVYKENEKRNKPERQALLVLLEKAREWVPPTENHEKLKFYMVEELEGMIASLTQEMPKPISGSQYRDQLMEKARQDIVAHTAKHAEKVQGARDNRNWVCALRRSLKRDK